MSLPIFNKAQVDLVLLDVVMPGIDGFMTCREIRSLPDGVHLPVVMIAGIEDAETIKEAFDALAPMGTFLPRSSPKTQRRQEK